jgi:hypothetical protein
MSIKTNTFKKGETFTQFFNSYAGVTAKSVLKKLAMDSVYV